jgi:hypothetical protein
MTTPFTATLHRFESGREALRIVEVAAIPATQPRGRTRFRIVWYFRAKETAVTSTQAEEARRDALVERLFGATVGALALCGVDRGMAARAASPSSVALRLSRSIQSKPAGIEPALSQRPYGLGSPLAANWSQTSTPRSPSAHRTRCRGRSRRSSSTNPVGPRARVGRGKGSLWQRGCGTHGSVLGILRAIISTR